MKHSVCYVMTYGRCNIEKLKHTQQLFSVILAYFFIILKHAIWKTASWNEWASPWFLIHSWKLGTSEPSDSHQQYSYKESVYYYMYFIVCHCLESIRHSTWMLG